MLNNLVEFYRRIWIFNEYFDDWENVIIERFYGFSNFFKWIYK